MAIAIDRNDTNWVQTAGLDFAVEPRDVFISGVGRDKTRKALVRADNDALLGLVGSNYRIHQPSQIASFFASLATHNGYIVNAAGVRGSKIWVRARQETDYEICDGDVMTGSVLLATSFDGSLATVAVPDTSRMVCDNRLTLVRRGGVRIRHNSEFTEERARQQLNITGYEVFIEKMRKLARQRIGQQHAERFFATLLGKPEGRAFDALMSIWKGETPSATTAAARYTRYGLLNDVTYYVDHVRGRDETREEQATFGAGNALKHRARDLMFNALEG